MPGGSSARRRSASSRVRAPHDGRAAVRQRQQGQRSGRQEPLPGGASMGLGRAHMRDQRILVIGMSGGGDAEQLAGRGRPRRRRRSAAGAPSSRPSAERDTHAALRHLDGLHGRLDQHRARGTGRPARSVLKRLAIDDESQIRLAEFGAIEGQRPPALAASRSHPTRTCARTGTTKLRRQSFPNTAELEHPLRGPAQSEHPQVPRDSRGRGGRSRRPALLSTAGRSVRRPPPRVPASADGARAARPPSRTRRAPPPR